MKRRTMQHRLVSVTLLGLVGSLILPRACNAAMPQDVYSDQGVTLRQELSERGLSSLLKTGFGSTHKGEYIFSFRAKDPANFDGQTLFELERVEVPFGLELTGTKVTDELMEELAKQPNLVALELGETDVSDEGIALLRDCRRLETLDVAGTRVTAQGLWHLRDLDPLHLIVDTDVVTQPDFQVFQTLGDRAWQLRVNQTPEVFHALRLAGKRHWWPAAAASEKRRPESEREITKLRLGSKSFGDPQMKDLEDLMQLKELTLSNTSVGDAGAEILAQLESLEWLGLSKSEITDSGVRKLSALSQLGYLNLEDTAITDESIKTIQKMAQIRHIDLSATSVTHQGLESLAQNENLNSLDVRETPVFLDQLVALSYRPNRLRIRILEGQIRRRELAKVDWSQPPNWRLNLRISDEVFETLAEVGLLYCLDVARTSDYRVHPTSNENVTRFIANVPGITDRGAAVLSGLPNLQELRMHAGLLTDASGEVIGELSQLKILSLINAESMTDQTAFHIGNLTELEELTWSGSQLTDQGLKQLATLSSLRRLRVTGRDITAEGKEWLQSALPNCAIR